MNYVIHVKYSTLHRQFLQVFTIEPRLNHMKDCIAGRCRQLLTIFKAEPFKSPLTLSTAWQKRVAVRVQPVLPHLVDLQSAFEVRQLGTLRTHPQKRSFIRSRAPVSRRKLFGEGESTMQSTGKVKVRQEWTVEWTVSAMLWIT